MPKAIIILFLVFYLHLNLYAIDLVKDIPYRFHPTDVHSFTLYFSSNDRYMFVVRSPQQFDYPIEGFGSSGFFDLYEDVLILKKQYSFDITFDGQMVNRQRIDGTVVQYLKILYEDDAEFHCIDMEDSEPKIFRYKLDK